MATQGNSGNAMGGQIEEKADLSAETDAKLEQSQTLVTAGQLPEALVMLAALGRAATARLPVSSRL
jgi:hypothetical protein